MSPKKFKKAIFEPDFDNRKSDGYEAEDYGECSPCQQVSYIVNFGKDVRKTVVSLEPEKEIRLHRGLNDEDESHWEKLRNSDMKTKILR